MEAIALGTALGLFAGIIPGAFLTLVATTALERGRRQGVTVALIPLVTETFVLLCAVLVLTRLSDQALRWVGIAGGLLLLYMAWRVAKGARGADPSAKVERLRGHFLRVALVGILSPSPWIFWFFIGGPLLLNRWNASPVQGIAFGLSFMICFVGVMVAVAWGAAGGRRFLNLTWYRRILGGAGGVLALLGILLVWQSWVGNFQEMIQAPEQVQEELRR